MLVIFFMFTQEKLLKENPVKKAAKKIENHV